MPHSQPFLKPFAFDQEITPELGLQDKLDISCNFGTLGGSSDDIGHIRYMLSVPSKEELCSIKSQQDLFDQQQGWIFNRPPSLRFPLKIRSDSVSLGNGGVLHSPLFSGRAMFKAFKGDTENSHFSVGLQLKLNPTRFVRTQRFGTLLAAGKNKASCPTSNLCGNDRLPLTKHEVGLDDEKGDNWIPDTVFYRPFIANNKWKLLLGHYFKGVFGHLRQEFERCASCHQVPFVLTCDKFHLQKVETYWEFASHDPIKVVRDIAPLLQSYSETPFMLKNYKVNKAKSALATTGNCPSISLPIKGGIELVVYAKTNKRIRFEVRHNLDIMTNLNNGARAHLPSIEQLITMLDKVRQDAASVLKNVFQFMHSHAQYPKDSASVPEFLLDFHGALKDDSHQKTLLSLLVHNRRIVVRKEFQPQVVALRKAGIVRAVIRNNRRANIPAPRYRKAIDTLALERFSFLEPRRR